MDEPSDFCRRTFVRLPKTTTGHSQRRFEASNLATRAIAQLMLRDEVIIPAAIVTHSKMRTRFTLGLPRLLGTKLAQWILLGEL